MQIAPLRFPAMLAWSGTALWLCVSATTIFRAQSFDRLIAWSFASAVFLIAFFITQRVRRHSQLLLALQSLTIIAMVAVLCNGYEGFLLVLVAAQLGWRDNKRSSLIWILVQTAALAVAIGYEWTPRSALLLTPPYLGFQLLMFTVTRLWAEERLLREQLQESHTHLTQLQHQLTQRGRLDERLRMTQELHDVFGHHLTALSLNLEATSHEVAGKTQETIRSAQSLVRMLLGDIKALVSAAKDDVSVDFPLEVRALARDLPKPQIHFDCPSSLDLGDPRTGRALLRCAQEIVTNSIRHGAARNVWLRVATESGRVWLVAHDDGAGADNFSDGFGLAGMRRRLEALGGSLTVTGTAQRFEVRAELPTGRTV